ncbi:MAG: cation transport ATPase, partial [Microbacterium sp.]|nr:cation transport ATPase [Microbacterium sp.]
MSGLLAKVGRGGLIGAGVVGAGGLLAAVAGGAVLSAVAAPLLEQAGQMGVDFAWLAEGVDPTALAEGAGVGEWVGGAQDAVTGLGDQVGGFGDQLSNIQIPGFDDVF